MTRKFAVFGNPIKHSLSPQIHQMFAKQCDLDIDYEAIEVPLDGFKEAVQEFFSIEGAVGANVTVPFKEQAYHIARTPGRIKEHSYREHKDFKNARDSEWANTLHLQGKQGDIGSLAAYNTDGVGLVNDMQKNLGWDLKDKRILIVGAGGAVRNIIPALKHAISSGGSISIVNRTQEKADILAEAYGGSAKKVDALDMDEVSADKELSNLADKYKFDIMINGTSFGLGEDSDADDFIVSSSLVHNDLLCYDLVYNKNRSTNFTRWAKKHNANKAVDGLGMLVEQAAQSFCIWNGLELETLDTKKVIESLTAK